MPVPLSLGGYFLIEVPLQPARIGAGPVVGTLRILAADGRVIASRDFLGQTFSAESDH